MSPDSDAGARLPRNQAAILGLIHGPAELLPVSSSAHTTIVPWLLGWRYGELDEAARKSFEVALHVGTAAGLAPVWSRAPVSGVDLRAVAAACLAPGLAGYALEGWIERRLGTPAAIAGGLAVGSVAMVIGDRAPARRTADELTVGDGWWLGMAQAAALLPGVSRSGATLAAARARGFGRRDAEAVSRLVGLPVIVGAAGLRGARLLRRGLEPELRPAFAAGAGAAFASAFAVSRWARPPAGRRLLPWAVYRVALAGVIAGRLRRATTAHRPAPARP